MKNIKIIILTAILSVGLTISGSVFSAVCLSAFRGIDNPCPVPNSASVSLPITNNSTSIPSSTTIQILSDSEQIAKGYKFNIYTGQKLVEQISSTEARFRAIEKRLDLLEANR